ncbi:DUF2971 domain-containing protein [Treponema sp.]|uniref:DUF2971 domain-containing protein n=1 Tax=Treponema sp. TaxID=166 RepID=UPI00298DC741|nr:DUF2971 domain-containing protein [Treponema sp.]MCR5614377.1 DUF2971 domain-containing protein [Treponema sp.]
MTFYKYKTINDFTLDSLQNKYFYYSRQEQLDDPFDMYTPVDILRTDEEIQEYFRRDPELASKYTVDSFRKKQEASEFDEEYHNKFLKVNQMFHVLSLTLLNDNDAMWALYADNYRGIAIGYKVIEESNNKYSISLGQKRPINQQRNFLLQLGKDRFYENPDLRIVMNPVEYNLSKLVKFTPLCTDPSEILGNVFIKKPIWKFEKEYRSVIISPWHTIDELKIFYPDEVLCEIIFGYRTSDEDIKKVIELIIKNYKNFEYIKYYRAVPNRNKFTIELKELTGR